MPSALRFLFQPCRTARIGDSTNSICPSSATLTDEQRYRSDELLLVVGEAVGDRTHLHPSRLKQIDEHSDAYVERAQSELPYMAWFVRQFSRSSPVLRVSSFAVYRFPSSHSYSCSLSYTTMSKFNLNWGILATGGIAESFTRDLYPNPECRGVKDIQHTVVAAASSSSADRAKAFLKEVRAPESAKAYGSYKELVADPNVDIIYVATPHSHHYQNAMLCLEAGKNVLCEKAFTTNAKQTELLIKKAKEKNVFLMEAVSLPRMEEDGPD